VLNSIIAYQAIIFCSKFVTCLKYGMKNSGSHRRLKIATEIDSAFWINLRLAAYKQQERHYL